MKKLHECMSHCLIFVAWIDAGRAHKHMGASCLCEVQWIAGPTPLVYINLYFFSYIINSFCTSASGRIDDTERKGEHVVNWIRDWIQTNEREKIGDNKTSCTMHIVLIVVIVSKINNKLSLSAPNATHTLVNFTNRMICFETQCSRFIGRPQVTSTSTPTSLKINVQVLNRAGKKIWFEWLLRFTTLNTANGRRF